MATFQLKNNSLLEVALRQDRVRARAGAMVAYEGNIKFEKSLTGGEGLLGAIKRKATGESFELMAASGSGTVYFAHQARKVAILPLQGDKISIESNSILAFDDELKTDVTFAGLRGATSGQGLFTTTVTGTGNVAVISDGNLIVLEVNSSMPLHVDPDAFVGYQGNLRQEFVFDVNWKTMAGHSSGETYQLKFTGDGLVYIQPSERL